VKHYVFDLDGTLVHTRTAVIQAYLAVGVAMPADAWGKPWQSWLKDETLHRRKNEVYPEALRAYAAPMPLLEVAVRLDAPVITGASRDAVRAVRATFAPTLNIALVGANRTEKTWWLSAQKDKIPGTYVDDNPLVRVRMREDLKSWKVISPGEAWVLLSSPRDAMSA